MNQLQAPCSFTMEERKKYANMSQRKDEEPEPQPNHQIRNSQRHPAPTPQEKVGSMLRREIGQDEEPDTRAKELPASRRGKETERILTRNQETESSHVTKVTTFSLAKFYTLGKLLGKGSLGYAYEAVRKSDGKKVAIKCVLEQKTDCTTTFDGRKLPLEVVLMKLVCKPPCCPYMINVLEWFETPVSFVYILDLPDTCIDLYGYCKNLQGQISESQAKHIMQQVVQAACHCKARGVFHGDIRLKNILLNTQTMEVKLIDFGSGSLYQGPLYSECDDSPVFIPMRWMSVNEKVLESCTVWQLGFVLHCLVGGTWNPGELLIGKHLSEDCRSLISWCMNPRSRPTLEQLCTHKWF